MKNINPEADSCAIRNTGPLRGRIKVPGDKSISHRAIILGSLAEGTTTIHHFLESEDCVATLNAFQQMGIEYERQGETISLRGRGLHGLQEPETILDMGNSGTGTRLLLGVLAGQSFAATLNGDDSLRKRPMGRVTEPLRQMGAAFLGRKRGTLLPLTVQGGTLQGIGYQTPVASAQIKSAILLAGLFANDLTRIEEPGPSRDHTERMLKTFSVDIDIEGCVCQMEGSLQPQAQEIHIPSDISSAAFFITAATIIPDSELFIESVGINPTRTGYLDVLQEMGANITMENKRQFGTEPVADLRVRHASLKGVRLGGETIVRMIDEFPVFAVAAAFAEGKSIVEDAEELRLKESDRISTIVTELSKMGVKIQEKEDGFEVEGGHTLKGTECESHGDHRIAMALAIAALGAQGQSHLHGISPIATSFPGFFETLQQCGLDDMEILS